MIDTDAFRAEFERRYGSQPLVFSAPGRVNLIGEHTDYNEGFVLPFAIDKRTFVGVKKRTDDLINVHTLTLDKTAQIRLGDAPEKGRKKWTLYIMGIAEMLTRKGIRVGGADMLIDSDIPFGAGLSSSAALEMAVGCAFSELAGEPVDLRELAFAGQKVEHGFVGVRSGIMDQFASGLSREGNAILLDCRSLSIDYVPVELESAMLVACDTKVKHSLASTAYNERRQECERGVEILAERIPDATALRDVRLDTFENVESILPEPVRRRCRHVITENIRTVEAAAALRDRDLKETGRLMNLSHDSLRDDYEVSCPELDLLVDKAREIAEVYGARMTGGGFGGCTINLLEAAVFNEFKTSITKAYNKQFGREPTVFHVKPSSGAHRVI